MSHARGLSWPPETQMMQVITMSKKHGQKSLNTGFQNMPWHQEYTDTKLWGRYCTARAWRGYCSRKLVVFVTAANIFVFIYHYRVPQCCTIRCFTPTPLPKPPKAPNCILDSTIQHNEKHMHNEHI